MYQLHSLSRITRQSAVVLELALQTFFKKHIDIEAKVASDSFGSLGLYGRVIRRYMIFMDFDRHPVRSINFFVLSSR